MSFRPYLMFEVGKAREAFARYQEIFGGELEVITAQDAPGDPMEGMDPATVLHAALMIDGDLLMASEDPTDTFRKAQGMWTSYTPTDTGEAKRIYDALAEGGETLQPLMETFFSPAFGMCVDRFGIPWMISTDPPEGWEPTG